MREQAFLSLLGLCRRAGRLALGHDPVLESLRRGKAKLVLLAEDFSARSAKALLQAAEAAKVPVLRPGVSLAALSAAVGRRAGALACEDAGFAGKLQELCDD